MQIKPQSASSLAKIEKSDKGVKGTYKKMMMVDTYTYICMHVDNCFTKSGRINLWSKSEYRKHSWAEGNHTCSSGNVFKNTYGRINCNNGEKLEW
jgi:hypothetical protein